MGILQERIRQLRKQNHLTQEQLAKKLRDQYDLKTDRVMVSKWEIGFQTPGIYTISCMANLFGVSLDYLNGKEPSTQTPALPRPHITEDFTTFPVIGEVAAGYDHIAAEDWEGEKIDVPSSYLKGRPKEDYFVLRVKGNSMYPAYQDGDRVLVLKQETLNYSGQVGVVLYGDDNATLKKVEFKMGEDWMNLVAINPTFPPCRIENEELTHCRVLGIPRLLIREINE